MHVGLLMVSPLAGCATVSAVALTVAATAHCVVLHVPCAMFAMLAPTVLSPNHAMLAELYHHQLMPAGALFVPSSSAFIHAIHAM